MQICLIQLNGGLMHFKKSLKDSELHRHFVSMCALILSIIVFGAFSAHAHDGEIFKQACALYEQKNYKEAAEKAVSLKSPGEAVWLLVADAQLKQNNYASALAAARRAEQQVHPSSLGLVFALVKTIKEKLGQPFSSYGESLYLASWLVPPISLQLIFLISWLLALWFLVTRKRTLLALTSWTLLLLSCAFLLAGQFYMQQAKLAVIKENQAQVYVGPDIHYSTLNSLSSGHEVIIKRNEGDWFQIADGNRLGWLKAQAIDIV